MSAKEKISPVEISLAYLELEADKLNSPDTDPVARETSLIHCDQILDELITLGYGTESSQ